MKLFLSSYRLGNNPEKLAEFFGENKKVAVIVNAVDFETPEIRKEKLDRELVDLHTLGLQPEEIDLREYFGKESTLREKLQEFGGVWVRGGNCFILRRAMEYSRFDKILNELQHNKDFVYAGYSAGACILSPNMKSLDAMDNPNIIPEGYKKEIIWEGLNLLPYLLIPHYQSVHPEAQGAEVSVQYAKENNIPYKTLKDGDVIIEEI
ncbi:MAG TPA: Type 1 glutamine amidotransferase-like domain-containing protein [Candidatus Eisenbacteria bacterium]|nr:Type 1 glutamine amidotransferase-like domain-containing protein [Candidatus Eisenbacteria bacterium]